MGVGNTTLTRADSLIDQTNFHMCVYHTRQCDTHTMLTKE